MKLELTAEQVATLKRGFSVTISRPVEVPKSIQARLNVLTKYSVQYKSQLNGVCDGESIPLIVGMVRLNIEASCVEFDVYDQHEVTL